MPRQIRMDTAALRRPASGPRKRPASPWQLPSRLACGAGSLLLHTGLAWELVRQAGLPVADSTTGEAISVTLLEAMPAPEIAAAPAPPPAPAPEPPSEPSPEPDVAPAPEDPPQERLTEQVAMVHAPEPLPVLNPAATTAAPRDLRRRATLSRGRQAPGHVAKRRGYEEDAYWMAVRGAVAAGLRPPRGTAVETSVVLRVCATAAGFEVLAPDRAGGVHAAAVREAADRVARRTRRPPPDGSAPAAEWVIRFATTNQGGRHENE